MQEPAGEHQAPTGLKLSPRREGKTCFILAISQFPSPSGGRRWDVDVGEGEGGWGGSMRESHMCVWGSASSCCAERGAAGDRTPPRRLKTA